MGLLRWFTTNWADTDEAGDAALAPVELPLPVPETLARVEAIIHALPCWQVHSKDVSQGMLRAMRRTRLWGFVDVIVVRLESVPGGTRIHARSQSRIGKADLGQNRRNLVELLSPLRSR